MTPGPNVTDGDGDMLFELTNLGGNAAERLEVYRIALGDRAFDGGLFGCSGPGDAVLELAQDGGTAGQVDPGDVVRVREYADGVNFTSAQNGQALWVTVMVLAPDQRSSDALSCSWTAVWSSPWQVGS